ncbi:MAG: hypothetical protein RRA35_03355 [Desulfomonilia bacterium]|nr:hypothetical protein [Desulfomonilia bacterium]
MKISHVLIYIAALVAAVFIVYRTANHDFYTAVTVTGATPLALSQKVPSGIRLEVTGLVKKNYRFTSSALRAFATTRIRTRELSPGGDFLGTYIYCGIPVFNILEGVAPSFPEGSLMDTPADFLVTFTSASGDKRSFSYGELLMTGDDYPPILAYHRSELLPSKNPETYRLNSPRDPLEGLCLVAPRDNTTARSLEHVTHITFSIPDISADNLPVRVKKNACTSTAILVVDGSMVRPGSFDGVMKTVRDDWIRIGHGYGFRGISRVEGYELRSFLERNVPDARKDDYFLFVSCDGYRCLFSGHEIFSTASGASMMIIDRMDGEDHPSGNLIACTDDYFIDRSIWGVTHLVVINGSQ